MYLILLFILVGISTLIAVTNWRMGLLLCFIVGTIQDPIRKVTPGNPAYLILAVFPIYFAMALAVLATRPAIRTFLHHHPRTLLPGQLFFVILVISSLQTLTYGSETLPMVILGWAFYIGWFPAVLLGFFFVRKNYRELDIPLVCIGGIISIMLLGVPLEYAELKLSAPWLGTVAMTGEWRRWYSDTHYVRMISGFYRAPEIMAWHAATLSCIGVYLLIRMPTFAPLWVSQIAWGLGCVALSGRRKMFIVVVLFAAMFVLLADGRLRGRLLAYVLAATFVVGWLLFSTVDERYLEGAHTGLTGANPRLTNHAITGPLWLLGIVGPFGFGVGTKSQGAQHLSVNIDTPLVEGGLEKMLVELGIVGTLVAGLLALALVAVIFQMTRRLRRAAGDTTALSALLAFIGANLMAFSVAFQVYGDPLIDIMLGFCVGLILSAARLAPKRIPNLESRFEDRSSEPKVVDSSSRAEFSPVAELEHGGSRI